MMVIPEDPGKNDIKNAAADCRNPENINHARNQRGISAAAAAAAAAAAEEEGRNKCAAMVRGLRVWREPSFHAPQHSRLLCSSQ